MHRVETTDEHLYWVQGSNRWLPAGDLMVGDILMLAEGEFARLEKTTRREIDTVVYNFDVENYQSYFANGALVYQQCGGETDSSVTNKLLHWQEAQSQSVQQLKEILKQPVIQSGSNK